MALPASGSLAAQTEVHKKEIRPQAYRLQRDEP